jgi:hypothetical protein
MVEEKHSNYAFFLVLLLMVPFKNWYVFYVISFSLIFIFTFNERLRWNSPAKILAIGLIYFFFMTCFRFLTTFEPIVRDYVELFRYMPLLYLMLNLNYFKSICYDDIIRACFVYLLIDGSVTLLQFFNFNFLGIIDIAHTFYTSDGFFTSEDMTVTNRSPGLSAEIGGHGAILMCMTFIMLSGIMTKCHYKWLPYSGFVLSLVLLILTQSRTAFVATIFILFLALLLYLLFGYFKHRRKVLVISTSLICVSMIIFINYYDSLKNIGYLMKLADIERSEGATAVRFAKWAFYFEAVEEQPLWLLTGWGKDFFGAKSGRFDNDFLYFFFVYGPFVLMSFLLFYVRYIFKILLNFKKYALNNFEVSFFFALMGGGLIAFFASFFLYPQIIFILFFLFCGKYWEGKKVKEEKFRPVV